MCIRKASLQLNEGICPPTEIWNSSLESCWYSAAQMLHRNLNHGDDFQLNAKCTYVKTFSMCSNWESNNLYKYNTTRVDDLKLIQNLHKKYSCNIHLNMWVTGWSEGPQLYKRMTSCFMYWYIISHQQTWWGGLVHVHTMLKTKAAWTKLNWTQLT
jgi:hypothetical protein